ALESSFFPFPSEVVLPPAGYLAAHGLMNGYLALGAGILGSLVGALFNYWMAVRLGRPLLHRYGRYLLISEHSLDRSEAFFRRHGEISTFVGRLLPVIRQYISLPAGLARMRLDLFALYTSLGAGIWCAVLYSIGWSIGKQVDVAALPPEEVHRYVIRALLYILPALALIIGAYVWKARRRAASS
ncbi:MAG TPA: DedA family protein, partial [Gemmatimonadales bacterium]|nr:DedA family protein [Gemmatimonadales bacterium]